MRALSQEEFINQAKIIHNNKYTYLNTDYINTKIKIIITCAKHGDFLQIPLNHLKGKGCTLCARENRRYTQQEFIDLCRQQHGNRYDYGSLIYENFGKKIKIICPIHGLFEQIASDHLKHGCNKCAIEFRAKAVSFTQEEIIKKFIKIHGDKYDYSLMEYKNQSTKVKIICKKHGIFLQKPQYHWTGSDCQKCAKAGTSFQEEQWLDVFNIPSKYRQFSIKINNKKIKVDGYDPLTKTVYEYNGDFWHGNPIVYSSQDINDVNHKTFGQLYQETIERENLIKSAGYHLIVKWETEI